MIQQHHIKINSQILPSHTLTLEGELYSDPKQGSKSISAELKVLHLSGLNKGKAAFNAKVLIYMPKEAKNLLSCRKGDNLRVTGRVTDIRPNSNPGAFDYKKFCFFKGIKQQIFIKEKDWQIISKMDIFSFSGFAVFCRERWSEKLEHYIQDKERAGVVKALLLGVKDDVREDLYQSFSRTGAIHVLAVSGLHVGAVLYVFVLFFKRFKHNRFLQLILQPVLLFVIALFYVLLTGASPSVCRAVLMFGLLLAGRIWFRRAHSINILMVSAIWMLLYDPNLLFNLSFQFSYLSLAGILLFQPFIRLWYIPENKVTAYVWELISVSVAAQILVFPLSVYYFNQFPVYFALTNIIAIPMAIMLVYVGFVLLFIQEIVSCPLHFFQKLFEKSTGIFIDSIQWMASWPGAGWENLYLESREVFVLYIVILFIYIYLQNKKLIFFYGSVMLVFLLLCNQLIKEKIYKNQSLLCVYDSNKDIIIDFFDGTTAFCLKSEKISLKKENQLCRKNRIKNGIRQTIFCSDSLQIRGRNFIWSDNNLYFKDKKVILTGYRYADISAGQKEDVMLISNGTKWPGSAYFKKRKIPYIILTGNLAKSEWQQWTACLEENRIFYRDVRQEGYIQVDMNKVIHE